MSDGLTVEVSPIDKLMGDRSQLQTPVVDFSRYKDEGGSRTDLKTHFKKLLPLTHPKSKEQFAFEVDLDRCTGCKSCVAACHSMNGLEDDESWRDVGLIQGEDVVGSYVQTITTACHHCVDPGCLNGCPVLAYEKDEETGIVRHLDDQCIGCQYCVMKCPYDVPKYSKSMGIVRKCDMCYQRLAEGEAPACVQACPTEAIKIITVNQDEIRGRYTQSNEFMPDTVRGDYTFPTTQYKTERKIPKSAKSCRSGSNKPESSHLPLVVMLVLSQLSLGVYALPAFFDGFIHSAKIEILSVGLSLGLMALGLFSSILHLGRPMGAWKAFLGVRRSWLSREILSFGVYFPLLVLSLGFQLFGGNSNFEKQLMVLTFAVGCISVFTSVMVYHDTERESWNWKIGIVKFFGTSLIGFFLSFIFFANSDASIDLVVGILLAMCLGMKVIIDVWLTSKTSAGDSVGLKQAASLLRGPLKTIQLCRYLTLATGGFCLLGSYLFGTSFFLSTGLVVLGVSLWVGSELLERILFFKSSDAYKMPGGYLS